MARKSDRWLGAIQGRSQHEAARSHYLGLVAEQDRRIAMHGAPDAKVTLDTSQAAQILTRAAAATGRDVDAHNVLGPALEGFSPTPEFPEIAEATALLDALAQTDAVKAAAASRKQRVDLHATYGAALLQGRGIHAPETRAAFERARELSAGDVSRPQITFGLWAGAYARGELGPMRALADALQQEVADSLRSSVAGVAQRVQGVTSHFQGDFLAARSHLEQALAFATPSRARVKDSGIFESFKMRGFVSATGGRAAAP